MNSPYLPTLDHVRLPDHPSLPFSCAGEAYGEIYSLFAPRLSMSFFAQGKPDVDMHLYVFSTGASALVSKTGVGPVEVVSIFQAGEGTTDATRHAAETGIEKVVLAGYKLSQRSMPTFTPEDELALWTQVAGPLGLGDEMRADHAEGYADLVLAQLGDVLLKRHSDDDLQQALQLACAFVAADEVGMLGQDFFDDAPKDAVQLVTWAYLLIRAGRGTREGAVIALKEMAEVGEEEDFASATEALFNRIGLAHLEDLQEALNDELAVLGLRPEDGPYPVRHKLACAVAQDLAPLAGDLYDWLQTEDGFTAWLRPDFAMLGDYREGL